MDIIVTTLYPVFIITEGAWFWIIYRDWNYEDEGFLLIEPILVAFFYFFLGLATILALRCDYWKAIAYYDPEEIAKHEKWLEQQTVDQSDDALPEEAMSLMIDTEYFTI